MKEYLVRLYEQKDYKIWNTFVSESKNGTFLFHRDFMEYHKDRFDDFSLLVFDNQKLVSVLPANRVDDQVYSHLGLTYGELLYKENLKLTSFIKVFATVLQFLQKNGISKMLIKAIPTIYHLKPAEEIKYVLFLMEAKLIRRDSLSVVDVQKQLLISKGRMEGVRKGVFNELKVIEEAKFDGFWEKIMIPNLMQKHNAKPVHSVAEINLLQSKFPNMIRQFNVYYKDEIVAGTTIFESKKVAHAQYISGNESKSKLGSLDYLFHHLLTNVFKDKSFLDFGISNEYQGKKVNEGLLFWKESFGASTIVQDFYEVETAKFSLLENVIL